MRILIVEDDMELCNAVKFHLEQEGYIVDTCLSGEDGLHFIKQEAYDIILLDRLLPELDGMDVLSRTRASGITSQIIMITALDGIGDRIAGLDAGADDYIVKPFDINELCTVQYYNLCAFPLTWTPAYGSYPCQQLIYIERLYDVIVRTGV